MTILSPRTLLVLALTAGDLVSGSSCTARAADAESSSDLPQVTRVFYLQGMKSREAVSLLRSQVQVRKVAMIGDRSVIVVSDTAERVDQSERLLRQRDSLTRATDPHAPLDVGRLAESPKASRVFRVRADDMSTVVTVLRSIYNIREVKEFREEESIYVNAAQPVLDSSEALLRELGLLVEPAKVSGS